MARAAADRRPTLARGRASEAEWAVPVPALVHPPWAQHRNFRVVLPDDLEAALQAFSPRPLLEAIWQLLLEARVRQSYADSTVKGGARVASELLEESMRSGCGDATRVRELEWSNLMLQGKLVRQDEYLAQLRASFYQQLLHLKQRLRGDAAGEDARSQRRDVPTSSIATATEEGTLLPPTPRSRASLAVPAIAIPGPQYSAYSQTEGTEGALSTAATQWDLSDVHHEDKEVQTDESSLNAVPHTPSVAASPQSARAPKGLTSLAHVRLDGMGQSRGKTGEPPPRSRHLFVKALQFAKRNAVRVQSSDPDAAASPTQPHPTQSPASEPSPGASDGGGVAEEGERIARTLLFSPRAAHGSPPLKFPVASPLASPSPGSPSTNSPPREARGPRGLQRDAAVECRLPCANCGAGLARPDLPNELRAEVDEMEGLPVQMRAILTAASSFRLPLGALRESLAPSHPPQAAGPAARPAGDAAEGGPPPGPGRDGGGARRGAAGRPGEGTPPAAGPPPDSRGKPPLPRGTSGRGLGADRAAPADGGQPAEGGSAPAGTAVATALWSAPLWTPLPGDAPAHCPLPPAPGSQAAEGAAGRPVGGAGATAGAVAVGAPRNSPVTAAAWTVQPSSALLPGPPPAPNSTAPGPGRGGGAAAPTAGAMGASPAGNPRPKAEVTVASSGGDNAGRRAGEWADEPHSVGGVGGSEAAVMARWSAPPPIADREDAGAGADPQLVARLRELERQRATALLDGDLRLAATAHRDMRLVLKRLGLAVAGAEDAVPYPDVLLSDHIAAYLERRSPCRTAKETFHRTDQHRPFIDSRRSSKHCDGLIRLPPKRPLSAAARLSSR